MIPAIPQVDHEVRLEERKIVVQLMEGLIYNETGAVPARTTPG